MLSNMPCHVVHGLLCVRRSWRGSCTTSRGRGSRPCCGPSSRTAPPAAYSSPTSSTTSPSRHSRSGPGRGAGVDHTVSGLSCSYLFGASVLWAVWRVLCWLDWRLTVLVLLFVVWVLQKQTANKWLTTTFSSSMEVPEEALAQLGKRYPCGCYVKPQVVCGWGCPVVLTSVGIRDQARVLYPSVIWHFGLEGRGTGVYAKVSSFADFAERPAGFGDTRVLTVGEEPASYGIWALPVVPREQDKEVMRTYLCSATVL
jgi:hypothetical protein